METSENDIIAYVVIPLFIFFARICDVSLSTLRIINISKGNRALSTVLGFFEVLIWLFAIQQIMQNLNNVFYYIVYSGGYATGTFVGMYIEQKMIKGKTMINIITDEDSSELTDYLNTSGFRTTLIKARGDEGKESFILTIADRKNTDLVVENIERLLPNSFYMIEDLRLAGENRIPHLKKHNLMAGLDAFRRHKAEK